VIRLGVVGHRGYTRLPEVLHTLLRVAPELDIALQLESKMRDVAGEGAPLGAPQDIDALLSLGGDGTLLRGVRFLAGRQVPVLGINLGRLGFLTSCSGLDLEAGLRRFAAGDYLAEARLALDASLRDGTGVPRHRWHALNDIVLHKGGFARVVRLIVSSNGEEIARYSADGVIIATPTGSTAYSLSAGGPVVEPSVDSILITPISPHTLATRPLVLAPTATIMVRAEDNPQELLVTVDGQVGTTFAAGEALEVSRAGHPVLIVRFPGATYFTRLRQKLGWGSRPQA
jgi:NAD+ kinase